jgi:hypothetical protein
MVVNNHYEFQKCTFASLVVKVLDLILSKINIKNGFKVTWNEDGVTTQLLNIAPIVEDVGTRVDVNI